MIFEPLAFCGRHVKVHPRFAAAFDFLRTMPANLPNGREEIDGNRLFAIVQSYTTTAAAERKFEHHRKYADIQFLVSGEEIIEHISIAGLEVDVPYNAEKDYGLLREPAIKSATVLRPGELGIFFPEDAHKPGCSVHAPVVVRKVVVKVLL